MVKQPGLFETIGGLFAVISTFGLVCLADPPPVICQGANRQVTGPDGAYRFAVVGKDVRDEFGGTRDMTVSVAAARSGQQAKGAGISTTFVVQQPDMVVPDLRFWEPARLSAVPGGGKIRMNWTPFEETHGQEPDEHTVTFQVGDRDVWVQPVELGESVDGRAFEDFQGTFRVAAVTEYPGYKTSFKTTYSTPSAPLTGQTGAPPSREKPCLVAGERGPVPVDPCPLTDGRMDNRFPEQSCGQEPAGEPSHDPPPPCPANTAVTIDLGSPQPVGAVFTRDLDMSEDVVVETSDDGSQWLKQTSAEVRRFTKISLGHAVTARFVRLRAEKQGSLDGLTEMSVWPTP